MGESKAQLVGSMASNPPSSGKQFFKFNEMKPTYRGREKNDAEPLNLKSIKRMSLMMRSYVHLASCLVEHAFSRQCKVSEDCAQDYKFKKGLAISTLKIKDQHQYSPVE